MRSVAFTIHTKKSKNPQATNRPGIIVHKLIDRRWRRGRGRIKKKTKWVALYIARPSKVYVWETLNVLFQFLFSPVIDTSVYTIAKELRSIFIGCHEIGS